MLARTLPLVAVAALLSVTIVAPPAAAWTVVCVGSGDVVCLAYKVIIEIRDGYVSLQVIDTRTGNVLVAVCVKPPDVWVGDCSVPPEDGLGLGLLLA